MQIVIDIPDIQYEYLLKIVNAGEEPVGYYERIIMRGTPLPKHGRLIDADEFRHTLEDMPIRDNDKWFNWLQKACNRLADAPTIIDADKENEE